MTVIEIELEELQKLVAKSLHARQEVVNADQALYDFYRQVSLQKPKER